MENKPKIALPNSQPSAGLDLFALKKSIKEKQLVKSLKLIVNK